MTEGAILLDKPAGWTSHDAVAKLRGLLRERRIGHAGTLDPMATGLLVIAVGPATRLLRFAQSGRKRYEGVLRLGEATDTLDADGTVVRRAAVPTLDAGTVAAAARELTGTIEQRPPMVSAVRVGGRRLHELARAGEEVERTPRPVVVESFEVAPTERVDEWRFEVVCGPGTYVRVLASDLAEKLGTVGHLRSLRRTASSGHTVAEAVTLEQVAMDLAAGRPVLRPTADLISSMPLVSVDDDAATRLRHGRALVLDGLSGPYVGATDAEGHVVAVLERRDGEWWPTVVLAGGPREAR